MSFTSFKDRPLRTREEIARDVHAVSLRRGLDELATVIALMTIATEVGAKGQWWCPWNAKDPTSKNYPHDSESNDGRSVGYFQQQNGHAGETVTGSDNWWGSMQSRMTIDQAANTFLERLADDYGRAATNPSLAGEFAQRVQGSAFPGRYAQHWDEAWDVLRRALADQPPPGGNVGFTGDPVWLEDVLRDALGDRLVVEGDWVNRGTGGTMGDIWGVMIHHTSNINETVKNIRDGVQQPSGFLRGPLAQCLFTPDGKCHLIAVGPCNHAGIGSYPGVGTNNGNRRLIGFECCWPTPRPDLRPPYDPNELWSTPLIITVRDATAAVLKKLGYGSARAIGHKEYAGASQRKWDPGNMSMNWFRGEVQKDLDGFVFPGEQPEPQPDPGPVDPPTLPPPPNTRTDRQLLEEIWDQLRGPGGNGWPQLGGKTIIDYLAEIGNLATDLRSQLDDLRTMQPGPGPNVPPGAAAKRAAAGKRTAAKKSPAKKTAKKTPAKKAATKTP
jgi:N-acetylmuramoyl-L-alanine amidase